MSHPWSNGQDELTSESDPASLSPRTALLSPPPFEEVERAEVLPRRISRGPDSKFRRERERAHSAASPRELLQTLVNEEYESKQMRKIVYAAFDRLEHETKRADAAEARIEEMVQRARAIYEARVAALQQAGRAQDELKLYKLQLDNAQKEIFRAQDVLEVLVAQRNDAEAAAASARSEARRLDQERSIEMAREEGRRLGFEEGIRRGRRLGYREAYEGRVDDQRDEIRDVAAVVVDRLLEVRDGPEEIQVLEEPTPIPPPSTVSRTPEVHRVETPVNSSLENQRHSSRSRRDSSDSASRNTPRRIPDPVILPAPTGIEPRVIPVGTTSSRPQSTSQPWGGPPTEPPFGRPASVQNSPRSSHRPDIFVPPDGLIPTIDANQHISLPPPHVLERTASPTSSQPTLGPGSERGRGREYVYDNYPPPRRGSPDDSLASGKQSAASTISQLDLVGLPNSGRRRDYSQGLSVIHEDGSIRSERTADYSQTIGSTSQAGRSSFRDMRSSETLRRESNAKQRLADELRYSDPMEAEEWRRQSEGSRSQSHSQPPREGPPRYRPAHVTVPTPLSPPKDGERPDSRHRRATSERQARGEYGDPRQRRPVSSDESIPDINVEPPSGPPSDATSRGRGRIPASGLLSPDYAHHPLPVPAPPSPSVPVPSSPAAGQASLAGRFYTVAPDGQRPVGYREGAPQDPVIPHHAGSAGVGSSSSERERSPIPFYQTSPVPAGVTYPAPPISRSAAYNGYHASVGSDGRPRRRDSVSAGVGAGVASTASSTDDGGGGGGGSRVSRRQSTASLGSRRSQEPFTDALTYANTATNGGGGPVRPVRVQGSPAYSYATVRNE